MTRVGHNGGNAVASSNRVQLPGQSLRAHQLVAWNHCVPHGGRGVCSLHPDLATARSSLHQRLGLIAMVCRVLVSAK